MQKDKYYICLSFSLGMPISIQTILFTHWAQCPYCHPCSFAGCLGRFAFHSSWCWHPHQQQRETSQTWAPIMGIDWPTSRVSDKPYDINIHQLTVRINTVKRNTYLIISSYKLLGRTYLYIRIYYFAYHLNMVHIPAHLSVISGIRIWGSHSDSSVGCSVFHAFIFAGTWPITWNG